MESSIEPGSKAEDDFLATVVICTRNRGESLTVTLDSLVIAGARARDRIAATWEVLIVDNGSTDNTAEVIARYADRLPIRSVLQPVAGLSNARNAGIANARGRVILWTDDDVLLDEDWLRAHLEAFEAHPEVAIFGGRAVPHYQEPRMDWFVKNEGSLGSLLAIRDNRDWTEIRPGQLPFGLNYAVRRDVQLRHPYDPDLGVAPGRRIGGEESTMLKAALSEGAKGHWVWDATVYHLIPLQRQSLSYVLDYYRSQGFLYPQVEIRSKGAISRAWLYGQTALRIARMRAVVAIRRKLGRDDWVAGYADYARWRGTLRRLRHPDDLSRA